jgi:cyanophycinase
MKKSSLNNVGLRMLFCSSILIVMIGCQALAQSPQAASVGPQKGWLVLHGGGIRKENGAMHRFVSLAGGASAAVVVVLTPIDLDVITTDFLTKYRQWWKSEFGVTNLSFMDTRDRQVAETDAFVAPLLKATGVWISGGHLTNLLDSYLDTRTKREIKAVAERGGVIGGSSAGAMIQGSFLLNVTKTPSGAPLSGSRMFLDAARMVGFGLLREVTVYPHFSERHSEKDILDVLARYPDLLGIGIDEGTAIVVHDDQFEVIGAEHVGIFDGKNGTKKKYLTLSKGQKFDLKRRVVID